MILGPPEGIGPTRAALSTALGEAALVDAAGVVACYEMVDRVADASGIPLEDFKAETAASLQTELGIRKIAPLDEA